MLNLDTVFDFFSSIITVNPFAKVNEMLIVDIYTFYIKKTWLIDSDSTSLCLIFILKNCIFNPKQKMFHLTR